MHPFPRSVRGGSVLALLALAACNPTFNWREVPVGGEGVLALLPCKPDRASRRLPLGPDAIVIDMAGCQAGGATFAVAHASAPDAGRAEHWMRAWRAATRAQLGDAKIAETPAQVARTSATPAPVRLEADPASPAQAAAAQTARILWFGRAEAGGVSIYQASVLGQPASAEAAQTFFEGLRLP